MIETKEAVENIDEILAVPGLDSFVIGAVDLSMSMGFLGDAGRPDVQTAVDHFNCQSSGRWDAHLCTGKLITPSPG